MRPGFQMTFGADPGAVAQAVARFSEFAEAQGLPTPVRRSIQVALDEFVYNPIVYGFPRLEGGPEAGKGELRVELDGELVRVTIADNGPPFDPLAFADPDTELSVEDREIGGLGIHLVKTMMDEVGYRREGDRNVVLLVKRLGEGTKAGQRGERSMNVSTRTEGAVTIIAFQGNLDSNTSPAAQQAIDAYLAAGGKKLVVDFSALDYISSAGLRVLLGAAKKLQPPAGGFRLFGLNETVREVFEISGFSKILQLRGSEAEAKEGL
jgi:anti-anti-sigma factor